jgi:phage tail sheath protein FI
MAGIGATGTLPEALSGNLRPVRRRSSSSCALAGRQRGGRPGERDRRRRRRTGARHGIQALLDAQATLGVTPMILIAPGFTSDRRKPIRQRRPVPRESGCGRPRDRGRRSFALTRSSRARTRPTPTAIAYAGDFGSRRVFVVDPFVKVFDT